MDTSRDVVVAHYHEVGLKGRNRSFFEHRLASNIRAALAGTGYRKVKLISGRLLIWMGEQGNFDEISSRLQKVFGLSGFSPAVEAESSMGSITQTAVELAEAATFETFAVRARRGNSSFPEKSQRVNEVVGQAIREATGARVHLDAPEWTCHIELVENRALLYSDRIPGPGGLPVGSSGRTLALLSGGIDSPVAAWRLAKRGSAVSFVHFHGQPYADPSSVRQATRLAQQLRAWIGPTQLWLIPFGEIQSEIVTHAAQELRIVLYRRFMMRIAETLALQQGAGALVTGESLGQVASQTLPNMAIIDEVVQSMPVLRPLVGSDKIEIEAVARTIGTYEISIEPHQDCCVLFVPRAVTTAARKADIDDAEARLDVGALVEKGVANATVVEVA